MTKEQIAKQAVDGMQVLVDGKMILVKNKCKARKHGSRI